MKKLVVYLLVCMLPAFFCGAAEAASTRDFASLSYESAMSLRISAPRGHVGTIFYLPPASPASLMNNDYGLLMLSETVRYEGMDQAVDGSGWKIVNTNPRAISLQPTYFWSGNELGVRANVWNTDRFLLVTFKVRY